MPTIIFVDSALRIARGIDSGFQIRLNDTVNIEDGRLRLDKLNSAIVFFAPQPMELISTSIRSPLQIVKVFVLQFQNRPTLVNS